MQRSTIAFLGGLLLGDAHVARRIITLPLQTFKGRGLSLDRGWGLWANSPGHLHSKNPQILWWPPIWLQKDDFISWRPLVHKHQVECTSPSRSKLQYIHSLPLNKWAFDWDFIPKVKLSTMHVINLEVKSITKSSLALSLYFSVAYHLKGSLSI